MEQELTSLMTLVWWGMAILFIYALLTFFVMEFAVDHTQPKTPQGLLRIKVKGMIINRVYQINCWVEEKDKKIPGNICQLYWGIFIGNFSFLLCFLIFCIAVSIAIGVRVLQIIVAFLLGYLPNIEIFQSLKDFFREGKTFKPYQRYGKNDEKKWPAPWKIITPLILFIYYKTIYQVTVKSTELTFEFIPSFLQTALAKYIGVGILLCIILLIWKFKFGSATKEFFMSIKDKLCIRVVPAEVDNST